MRSVDRLNQIAYVSALMQKPEGPLTGYSEYQNQRPTDSVGPKISSVCKVLVSGRRLGKNFESEKCIGCLKDRYWTENEFFLGSNL